ncbi:NAD(P) transhydrogenase subunit alpha [Parvularcula sp. LCG005]|uniref:NAD(P) transhydrogenase subunit alpha n=1 Tax=Parvularcula sp. LCG005 TaxID=3078805 RepID=UPI002943D8C3|nr:NAD(P) transhydrogenase subunit alpha [Parvularcula sp. LCG005]WOI52316.1 NAD(P) transhydrogenase subunit alpha [Parvularcula sp. LCG005]
MQTETVQDPAQAAEQAQIAAEELREAAERLNDAAQQAEIASKDVSSLIDPLQALAHSGGASDWVYLIAIFALACFVGYYVVWSVTPALHTPLMSVTNAISSVVIVGALIAVGAEVANSAAGTWSFILGVGAVFLASINIFGGFLVTQRMLAMYKKKER